MGHWLLVLSFIARYMEESSSLETASEYICMILLRLVRAVVRQQHRVNCVKAWTGRFMRRYICYGPPFFHLHLAYACTESTHVATGTEKKDSRGRKETFAACREIERWGQGKWWPSHLRFIYSLRNRKLLFLSSVP